MSVQTLAAGIGPTMQADVCVVGAGIAGLIAARRLAQRGRTVIVVESGGLLVTDVAQELNAIDQAGSPFSSATEGRFRGLGGSSMRWGGRFLPLTQFETGRRDHVGLDPWPLNISALEKYRPEVEALFHLDCASYEEEVLSDLDRKRLLPRADSDFVVRLPKWAPYKFCNLGNVLRRELEGSDRIQVILDATVRGFSLAPSGRLDLVHARATDQTEVEVKAPEFILAAGAVETARLMLLVDAETDGRAFAECDALGRYLQDHIGARVAELRIQDSARANQMFGYRFIGSTRRSVHLELSPAAQAADGVAAGFAHITMRPSADSATDVVKRLLRGRQSGDRLARGDLGRLARSTDELAKGVYWRTRHRQHFWPADLAHQMNVWIEQLPARHNRIVLSRQVDRMGVPLARVEWSMATQDEQTLRATTARLDTYWKRHRLDRWSALDWTAEVADPSGLISGTADQLKHPSGATRMGTNPRESVVAPDLSCHQVPNISHR